MLMVKCPKCGVTYAVYGKLAAGNVRRGVPGDCATVASR